MIYDFDYFNRFEKPQLVLCHSDDREIGIIQDAIDIKLVINLNEISTLSYKIYNSDELLMDDNGAPDEEKPNIYRLHRERRQVHVIGVGYFIITDIKEIEDEKGIYKEIDCKSCEYELNNIECPGVALKEVNMYPLYNNESYEMLSNYERFRYLEDITTVEVDENDTGVYLSESCILFNLLCYAPSWRLSDACIARFNGSTEIDPRDYSDLAATMRNLEDEDTTIYSFLKKNVSEAWDCFVAFNIEDRTIDIYKYEDMLIPSDTILSEANVLDKCEVKSNIDDYVNSLKVSGGTEDVYISDFTQTGENVIYNFDHDIAIGMIDGDLKDAIRYWQNLPTTAGNITIPQGSEIPKRVFPDSLFKYNGNDLYQFLYGSRRSLQNWSNAYEDAKAKGSEYLDELAPPQIYGTYEGAQTSITGTSFGTASNGKYKIKIETPLAIGDSLLTTEALHITYVSQLEGARKDIEFKPTGSNNTAQRQAGELLSRLTSAQFGSDKKLSDEFACEVEGDTITLTAKNSGIGAVGYYLTGPSDNITGSVSLTIETLGHPKNVAVFVAIAPHYDTAEGLSSYGVDSLLWRQTLYSGNISLSDAKKTLQYLNEELLLAEDCVMLTNSYREAYQVQMTKLGQERTASAGSNVSDSDWQQNYDQDAMWQHEYDDAAKYYNIANNLYTGYVWIQNQLETWVSNIESLIDAKNYERTFQGAFKKFYEEERGLNAEQASVKALELYNKLTRLIKQQKYQDDSIVITDAMSMMEKYEQEESLYNKSVNILARLVQPSAEITIDAEPFMFSGDYKEITKNIQMGYCIYVALPNGEVPLYHLNQITIDYDDPSCQLTFGDRIRSNDPADIFGDLQSAATTAANIVASERINWGTQRVAINYLMKEKDADIATTFRAMGNSVNNVAIDSKGLSCYAVDPDTNEEKYGFWGANGALMFYEYDSVSGERQPRVAIGRIYRSDGTSEYGFWGDKIIANSITAEKLAIGSITNGSNYLRNGSFEGIDGVVGESATVIAWENLPSDATGGIIDAKCIKEKHQSGSSSSFYIDSDVGIIPVGKRCIKIGEDESFEITKDDGQITISNPISKGVRQTTDTLSPGTYTLSFYYRLKNNNSKLYYGVEKINGSSVRNIIGHTYVNADSDYSVWKKEVVSFEVPPNDTRIRVTFVCHENLDNPGNNEGTPNAYLDGVMLAKGSNFKDSEEYSPHVSEIYAKYTAIDDNGVRIYNGNLTLYDVDGEKVIYTDVNNHNKFTVKGDIVARSLLLTSGNSDIPLEIVNGYMQYGSGDNTTVIATSEDINDVDESAQTYASNAQSQAIATAQGYTDTAKQDAKDYADGLRSSLFDSNGHLLNVDLGGWQISSTYGAGLKGPNSDYKLFLTSTPTNANSWVIWAGKTDPSTSSPSSQSSGVSTAFGVTADGKIYCWGAQVNGTIIANDGKIANWTIGAKELHNDYKTGMSVDGSHPAFWAGANCTDSQSHKRFPNNNGTDFANNKVNFMVDQDGKLYARGATIIGDLQLSSGTIATTSYVQDNMPTVPTNISAFNNDENYVTETGLTSKGYQTSSQVNNAISTALNGYSPTLDVDLGGWVATSTYGDGLRGPNDGNYQIYLTSTPEYDSSWVIWAGTTSPTTSMSSTAFGVTADGRLYCHGAQINGDIVCDSLRANNIETFSTKTTVSGDNYVDMISMGGSWIIGSTTLYNRTTYNSRLIDRGASSNLVLECCEWPDAYGNVYNGLYMDDDGGFCVYRIGSGRTYLRKDSIQFGGCSKKDEFKLGEFAGDISSVDFLGNDKRTGLLLSGQEGISFGQRASATSTYSDRMNLKFYTGKQFDLSPGGQSDGTLGLNIGWTCLYTDCVRLWDSSGSERHNGYLKLVAYNYNLYLGVGSSYYQIVTVSSPVSLSWDY